MRYPELIRLMRDDLRELDRDNARRLAGEYLAGEPLDEPELAGVLLLAAWDSGLVGRGQVPLRLAPGQAHAERLARGVPDDWLDLYRSANALFRKMRLLLGQPLPPSGGPPLRLRYYRDGQPVALLEASEAGVEVVEGEVPEEDLSLIPRGDLLGFIGGYANTLRAQRGESYFGLAEEAEE